MYDGMGNTNTLSEIKAYLGTPPQKPLTGGEFAEFWRSLSEQERELFKKTPLK